MFDRERFFAASACPFETVETAFGSARVYALTAGEKDALDMSVAREPGVNFRAKLVQATARDEDGRPLFLPIDVPELAAASFVALEPLVDAAIRVNRLGDREAQDLRKN